MDSNLMRIRRGILLNTPHIETKSGAIASFSTDMAIPLKSLVVNIEPVQSGSGDPSPTNIRPISGWSAAKVNKAGKNFLDMTVYTVGTYNPAVGTTFNLSKATTQFTKSADGRTFTVQTSATWRYFTVFMPIPRGYSLWRKMTLSSTGQCGISYGYLDKDFKVLYNVNSTRNPTSISSDMQPGDNVAYAYFLFTKRGTASATLTVTEPQVEIGTSASAYEEFSNTVYTVDLDGTRYGGTLDVLTGVLTVTDANIASYAGEPLPGEWISDRDVYAAGTSPTTGAQVVYKLAEPLTVQLTPEQISALKGTNNIWADTGDVEVKYWTH